MCDISTENVENIGITFEDKTYNLSILLNILRNGLNSSHVAFYFAEFCGFESHMIKLENTLYDPKLLFKA